jgi:hypothetical protein
VPWSGSGGGAKKTLRAGERDRAAIAAERAVFCDQVGQRDATALVLRDETGLTTAMTRLMPVRPLASGRTARPPAAGAG